MRKRIDILPYYSDFFQYPADIIILYGPKFASRRPENDNAEFHFAKL